MQGAIPEADQLWKQILANDPERRPVAAYDKDYKKRNRGTLLPGSGGCGRYRKRVHISVNAAPMSASGTSN
jgi:hypothetical protein